MADLPPGALRHPRADVLALLGVTDPDDACSRWWDGALAAALPTAFPGVLTGLLALRAADVAIGVVTLQDRDRLPWFLPPALTDLLDVVITRQDAPAKPAPTGCTPPWPGSAYDPSGRCSSGTARRHDRRQRRRRPCTGRRLGLAPAAALRTAGACHLLPDPTVSARPSCTI
ncbi:HAD family hydrolase [Streptomyces sp. M10(2022)]